jgi:hypothetical protein
VTFVQALPVQARSGTLNTSTLAVPAGLQSVTVRIDVPVAGQSNPFVLPAQQLLAEIRLSYDGGLTFPDATNSGRWNGMPTWNGTDGGWGKGGPPVVGVGFAPGRYPTHFRAGYTVENGPISFGVSVEEVA